MLVKTAKQADAVRLIAGHRHTLLFGGSRSGKTFLSCYAIAVRAFKAPRSRHAILRFRFNHVKQSVWYDTFPKMMAICFPEVKYKENKSDWFITMPNGSEIWFGGLDDKQRVEKILGNEYATIYFNECSQIPFQSIETALSRLAQKINDDGFIQRAYYDLNPVGNRHWSYRQFIEHRRFPTGFRS